ncbi:MAG: bifunctional glutamate N-acetyltransferase/amino-acid acetyltransferase ArgJ [Eubacteriales bacterium]
MDKIKGGVTSPIGFHAASVAAEIKYKDRKDMAMIYSKEPCHVAGVFTTNVVKAACVTWDKEVVANSEGAQVVVVNAGVANACTGYQGYEYCKETAMAAADLLAIEEDQVLVASTGVIGMQLPIERIVAGVKAMVPMLEESQEAGTMAAEAIMTTDTISKEVAYKAMIDGIEVTVGGMCKGSGMIHPNMSTMLGFLTTDIAISKALLQEALSEVVVDTFNMVSVDGDTSTNDTLLVLANGMAGNVEITEKNEAYHVFASILEAACGDLAQMMAGDGEGATALFETKVIHARSKEDARILAKSVICSSLTKAAIYGHDANWGRILCALGYSGAQFDPEKIELFFVGKKEQIQIYKDGVATDYSEEEASKILSEPKVCVLVDMKDGEEEATAWGCDLTYDYVKINADYRS